EGDVVVARTGEVLENVAEALGRDHAQVEAKTVVRDHRRLRVAASRDLRDPPPGAESVDQRRRVAGRRDEVEVAHGLAASPHAPGLRYRDRLGPRRELVDDTCDRGERLTEQMPAVRLVADAGLERAEDLLLTPRSHAGELAKPAFLGRRLEAGERRDPELRPDPRGSLRPHTGQPQELDHARRNEATALRERVHLPVLDDLDDLLLDRLPDPWELLRLPVERELCDGQRRLADPARRTAIRD